MENTILIVDDEAHIRLLLEESLADLEDEGVRLLSANNGREALERIREYRPRLVLLDVMMPELSGFDVCEIVRADPQLGDTYIIILTAKGQESDRLRGLAAGANEFVTKPFDPDDILERARAILGMPGQ